MLPSLFFPTFHPTAPRGTFVLDKKGRLSPSKPVAAPVKPLRQKKEKVVPIPEPPLTATRKDGGLLSFD
jgi:hypothetical protein